MLSVIPQEVLGAYKKLENDGFQVYLVGGSVRDLMLKREIKDWDFTTNAAPSDILKAHFYTRALSPHTRFYFLKS